MSKSSADTKALLEAWFLDDRDFSNEQVAAAGRAISESESLESRFDTLALAERALHDSDEPTSFERDFGRASFGAALDAMLADEQQHVQEDGGNPSADNVVPLRRRRRPVAAWASAAAVLFFGAFSITQTPSVSGPDEPGIFQARTAVASGWKARPDTPRLMAFCAERDNGDVVFTGPDQAPFGVVSCPLDAELKLAVERPSQKWKWAAFFGVYDDGTLMWYGPTPAARAPLALESGSDLQPIGESIRLNVNHKAGALRVHALYTTEPVDFEQLESWVATHAPQLFDNAMIVEPHVGTTDTQLFEVKP